MAPSKAGFSLSDKIGQSLPIDTSVAYDPDWVRGKTILITGGAGGFGEGFLRKWATHGANVIIGDLNVQKGDQLIREVRRETGNPDVHFIHCDVVNWESQVHLFREAIRLSNHGGIDVVVANAGVIDQRPAFEEPEALKEDEPVKPDLTTIDVNLTGLLYTTHLALFHLPRNPKSQSANRSSVPSSSNPRDRHLLLLGSIASMTALPGQALYGVSKHGVLGLFRSLRGTSFAHGIRVNMLCPYFIDTPIISAKGRFLLAGITMGKVEDVVDAATRFTADSRIIGRSLVVGPKLRVEESADGQMTLLDASDTRGKETAVWEAYAEDYENCDIFIRRAIGLFATAATVKGWTGFFGGLISAMTYTVRSYWA